LDHSLEDVAARAIQNAKQQGRPEVLGDDLLLGCLVEVARFGVAHIGSWHIDLAPFGIDWMHPGAAAQTGSVAYSDEVVALLDRAALVAKLDHAQQPRVVHLLACFAEKRDGIMEALRRQFGFDSLAWRAALASLDHAPAPVAAPRPAATASAGRPYFSPEEAADYLGVHIQTIRGYIRNGKLRALRIAGERAIRIRRDDLDLLLEPFPEE